MNQQQASKLREPFKPEQIGKLPRLTCGKCRQSQGKVCNEHKRVRCQICGHSISSAHMHLDFVGHAAATDRLLQVDPSWTWEPMALDEQGNPAIVDDGKTLNLWIKLTISGVTRPAVGVVEKGSVEPLKQLIGDAIRNGAMRFGVALDLWAKEDIAPKESEGESGGHGGRGDPGTASERAHETPAPPPSDLPEKEVEGPKATTAQKKKLAILADKFGYNDDERRYAAGLALGRKIASFNEITKQEASGLIEAWEASAAAQSGPGETGTPGEKAAEGDEPAGGGGDDGAAPAGSPYAFTPDNCPHEDEMWQAGKRPSFQVCTGCGTARKVTAA